MDLCLCIRVGLLLLVFCSCKTQRYELEGNKIVYRVFDSLERYFENEIRANGQPNGVIIDVLCDSCIGKINPQRRFDIKKYKKSINCINDSCKYFEYYGSMRYVYRIGLVFKTKGLQAQRYIFNNSNRYLCIKNDIYPIYFPYIDDDFGEILTHPSNTMNPLYKFPNVHFVETDIAYLVYFTPSGIRGARSNNVFIYDKPLEGYYPRK